MNSWIIEIKLLTFFTILCFLFTFSFSICGFDVPLVRELIFGSAFQDFFDFGFWVHFFACMMSITLGLHRYVRWLPLSLAVSGWALLRLYPWFAIVGGSFLYFFWMPILLHAFFLFVVAVVLEFLSFSDFMLCSLMVAVRDQRCEIGRVAAAVVIFICLVLVCWVICFYWSAIVVWPF